MFFSAIKGPSFWYVQNCIYFKILRFPKWSSVWSWSMSHKLWVTSRFGLQTTRSKLKFYFIQSWKDIMRKLNFEKSSLWFADENFKNWTIAWYRTMCISFWLVHWFRWFDWFNTNLETTLSFIGNNFWKLVMWRSPQLLQNSLSNVEKRIRVMQKSKMSILLGDHYHF